MYLFIHRHKPERQSARTYVYISRYISSVRARALELCAQAHNSSSWSAPIFTTHNQLTLAPKTYTYRYRQSNVYISVCVIKYIYNQIITTPNNGYLGSREDEERSEMRYVVWIAGISESSNLWTQVALSWLPPGSTFAWVPLSYLFHLFKSWIQMLLLRGTFDFEETGFT